MTEVISLQNLVLHFNNSFVVYPPIIMVTCVGSLWRATMCWQKFALVKYKTVLADAYIWRHKLVVSKSTVYGLLVLSCSISLLPSLTDLLNVVSQFKGWTCVDSFWRAECADRSLLLSNILNRVCRCLHLLTKKCKSKNQVWLFTQRAALATRVCILYVTVLYHTYGILLLFSLRKSSLLSTRNVSLFCIVPAVFTCPWSLVQIDFHHLL